ncbi:UDP-2,3-diacylglucosamine diphosphatase LpxI [Pararhodobacter sp. SW119]|uniref:LpxI family protein n=1 Tax=Pararhodobacter sp. SW119 TaxID=2780075 RepID=UPI001ADF1AD0|nr:UDP-2,3-diacylglucosamine diphosphatase LpxI [Pararhodobacter sp. SW119]
MTRLALIAGAGDLPAELLTHLPQRPLVCAVEGYPPAGLTPDLTFRIERLVPLLRRLQDEGVAQVLFAGVVHRPRLDPGLFDPETAALMPHLLPALGKGDDALLRAVIAVFEDYGLTVVGMADCAPSLLAGAGVLGSTAPDAAQTADAARGTEILRTLAPLDMGQGCVVAGGLYLAVEALYGTDAMLAHVAASRDLREPRAGGVLVKRAKVGQDLRMDLPAIGPATIGAARAARLSGICLQAGHVVILDRARTVAAADAAGIALWAAP